MWEDIVFISPVVFAISAIILLPNLYTWWRHDEDLERYWAWYRKLRQQDHARYMCLLWAWYNYQRYNIDGSYLPNGKRT